MGYYFVKIDSLLAREADLLVISSGKKIGYRYHIADYDSKRKNKYLINFPEEFDRGFFASFLKQIFDLSTRLNFESVEINIEGNEKMSLNDQLKILISYLDSFLEESELSVGVLLDETVDTEKELSIIAGEKIYASSLKKEEKKPQYRVEYCLASEMMARKPRKAAKDLESVPFRLSESFHEMLLRCLNDSNKSNSDVYNKGGLTRQVFSKIISNPDYIPKKTTIICLGIGLELNEDDLLSLLKTAGYTLSSSLVFVSLIQKFFEERNYDLDEINIKLNENNLPLLGWKPR